MERTARRLNISWILFAIGCMETAPAQQEIDVLVDQSEVISTVVELTWELDPAVDSVWVEITDDSDKLTTYPTRQNDNGTWSASIVGLKPGRLFTIEVLAENTDQSWASAPYIVETESPPYWLPELSLEVHDADRAAGGFLITSLLAEPSTPVIVDEDGEYVWWYLPYEDVEKVIRVRLSQDEQHMLYLEPQLSTPLVTGRDLVKLSLDGRRKEKLWSGVGLHHDFVEHADGTIGAIAYDSREHNGQSVLGDRIIELLPDGTVVEIWSAWDSMDPATAADMNHGIGWTHANAIDYDPVEEVYLLSLHNLSAIWKISRAGEVLWKLGGDESDFAGENPDEELFLEQHQFDLSGDIITVFDNGDSRRGASRVVEYDLNAGTGLVEMTWAYQPDPSFFCYVLGDVDRMENDHYRITWSTAGRIEEIDASQEVVWRIDADLGGAFGYTIWRETMSR